MRSRCVTHCCTRTCCFNDMHSDLRCLCRWFWLLEAAAAFQDSLFRLFAQILHCPRSRKEAGPRRREQDQRRNEEKQRSRRTDATADERLLRRLLATCHSPRPLSLSSQPCPRLCPRPTPGRGPAKSCIWSSSCVSCSPVCTKRRTRVTRFCRRLNESPAGWSCSTPCSKDS